MKTGIILLLALLGAASMAGTDRQDITTRNIAVVRGQTDELKRGDIEAAVADFAEDTRNFLASPSIVRAFDWFLRTSADIPGLALRDSGHHRCGRLSRCAL
jgi:hypothetical protein